MKSKGRSPLDFNGSSQKSLTVKIFAVGHRKIVDFPALAKNDKQLSFLQKSGAYFSPLKVFAIRSTFWGPRDCRNSTFIKRGDSPRHLLRKCHPPFATQIGGHIHRRLNFTERLQDLVLVNLSGAKPHALISAF